MSDTDELPPRERARVRSRDRKTRGPRVIVDNPGLKKLAVDLAEKRRRQAPPAQSAPAPKRRRRRPARLRISL
ncbi:MAG TPA: hypothetical protein VOB72_15870 [Candidatus Dormibacteraeota bacterium]|nr:hypothetical protein [Candidatus Dormibacteraeota bacterium]